MSTQEPTRFARADMRLLVVGALLLLGVLMLSLTRAANPPWEDAQAQVRAEYTARLGADAAAALPEGIQQIWIEPLARVDRCTTCHMATDAGEKLADAPHPARSHPMDILKHHPPETFGCTLCHGGQGFATSEAAAHGDVAFWEEPLLSTAKAEQYGLTRAELMELRCAYCHQTLEPVKGMPLINAAKDKIFDCMDCHRLPGLENEKPTAPDLTREGEKHPTSYAFPEGYKGPRTALAWQIEHLLDPKKMTPGSAMPKQDLTRKEAAGLALLVMSWRRQALPPAWTPKGE